MSSIGVIFALLAGTFWGVQNIWVKMLSAYGLEPMQIAFIKTFFAAISLAIIVLIRNPKGLKISIKDIWIFLCTGILATAGFSYFGFYTTVHGGVAISEVLTYTSPVFVMIISAIAFKEKITPKKLVALVMTILGCVLFAGLIGSGYRYDTLVIITGTIGGFCWSLYTIFSRFAIDKYEPFTIITWTFIVASVALAIVGDVPGIVMTTAQSPAVIGWGLCLGVVSAATPYLFYTLAVQKLDPSRASIISSFELIVGALAGMILFNEPHEFSKILGMIIILIAIILLSLNDNGGRKDNI